jgi:hypothetical protein
MKRCENKLNKSIWMPHVENEWKSPTRSQGAALIFLENFPQTWKIDFRRRSVAGAASRNAGVQSQGLQAGTWKINCGVGAGNA